MKISVAVLFALVCASWLLLSSVLFAESSASPKNNTVTAAVTATHNADAMRVQGEFRYRANCGRCHSAPQKFPPRMMATVLRHMRVRATITDEDMRLVLFYMTQ
ncbi:MAG TPA: cytochrome c [Candidatus Binatia bacterium]|nr:cytochrome c [Candidatus Binatia bacterium]